MVFSLIKTLICLILGIFFGGFCDDDNGNDPPSDEPLSSCPSEEGTQASFRINSSTRVSIQKSSGLCTLSALAEDGTFIPVGRSYKSNDWELSGSLFAISKVRSWSCGGSSCDAVLPGPYTYVLHRRSSDTVSSAAATVRFLERASFGATPDQARSLDFSGYIRSQANTAPTYHREFFRKHANPRWDYHQPEFASVDSPCGTSNTYWRRHIVSLKDRRGFVDATESNGFWTVLVDGHVRSIKQNLRFERSDRTLSDGFRHEVCSRFDEVIRGRFELRVETGACSATLPEDWVVAFETAERPPNVLSQTLPPLSDSSWTLISDQVPQYLLKMTLPETSCNGLEASGVDGPPIFAQTSDGEWLIYEPRLVMRKNTIDDPIIDGGLSSLEKGETAFCSNVPRNFLNEAGCRYSESACTSESNLVSGGAVVCGSRGEVANDPSLGDNWLDISSISDSRRASEFNLPEDAKPTSDFASQRKYVWSQIALTAPDQLRQRVAWALFQIFALPPISVRASRELTEELLAYYDIFVHHAFGNYRDVLREVSYNGLMAESLSFLKSKSLGRQFNGQQLIFPDENYARELMQLFTIGLVRVNMDGTPLRVTEGNNNDRVVSTYDSDNIVAFASMYSNDRVVSTYDSDNIVAFASIWTGFNLQSKRANTENNLNDRNQMDPIDVTDPNDHDRFPKHDLYGGFIGDKYPLCVDLPDKLHLRKGAKYRLLGSNPRPQLVEDESDWVDSPTAKRLRLQSGSALYSLLCRGSNDSCNFPGLVIIENNIICGGGQSNYPECDVDTVRVVEVGSTGVYYEYVPNVPCVELAFYENGVVVHGGERWKDVSCANKALAVASEACCEPGGDEAIPICTYSGERMTFETARSRCIAASREVCYYRSFVASSECPHIGNRWTNEDCTIEAKVDERGWVAIVHHPTNGRIPMNYVRENTPSFFKVQWKDGAFPNVSDCVASGCRTSDDGKCICPVTVSTDILFSAPPDSPAQILASLPIGHADPALYDSGTFQSNTLNGFTYYSIDGSCCDADTVFETTDDRTGQRFFLKNSISTVSINSGLSTFRFRNAPHFNKIVVAEYSKTDVHHEVEALLDHLFYHENTAPFVAHRFIQRFGISNPSPRYVEAVATAFQNGSYQSFGSGRYGDLEATVAAVLLDREATTLELDNDPSYGSLREQILKVISFMKALEFTSAVPLVQLDDMEVKVGQAPWEQPTVFNFFRSEYSPPGRAGTSSLAAPEAETMSSGNIIGLLNGLVSMALEGLIGCDVGFGHKFICDTNDGLLSYVQSNIDDPNTIVANLALLLTANRLSSVSSLQIIGETSKISDRVESMKQAIKYIATTPEFHTTNKHDPQAPTISDGGSSSGSVSNAGYKAVIHLALRGGCDSFHMLAPHTSCGLYQDYQNVRGSISLTSMSSISVSGQSCGTYGLHSSLSSLRSLYNSGDLAFLANTGVLTAPATKDNYKEVTLSELFGHNTQQDEVDTLDSENTAVGTGTLGRMADSLQRSGYRTSRISVDSTPSNLAGRLMVESPIIGLVRDGGVKTLDPDGDLNITRETILSLNGDPSTRGVFGHTWAELLTNGIDQADQLSGIFAQPSFSNAFDTTSNLGKRFQLIAEMIATREQRQVDRDHFFVTFDGFDMHGEVPIAITEKFDELNRAMTDLTAALKNIGVWNDVVIVQTSDFGRTLSPNSGGGSDHGWAGNSFIAGGSVRGGRFFGTYPDNFDEDGPLNIGRGRLIPTTSWDSVFNGIAQWMGVTDSEELDTVLPSRGNFNDLLQANQLFN